MADFKKRWKAECPKCDSVIDETSITCSNCGKDTVHADRIVVRTAKSDFFGCRKCSQSYPYLDCPKCGCNIRGVAKIKGMFGYS